MDYINQPASQRGGCSSKKNENDVNPVKSGKTLHRLVGVSFGLLCVLQAALNISLRLVYSKTDVTTSPLGESCNNLTERIENLKAALLHSNLQDWVYFQGSFYYISNIKKSWQDSREDCLRRGADLVIINSKEEQDFTRKLFGLRWIGLRDTDGNDKWTWVDGSPLSQSYWHPGEPNNHESKIEECVEIKFHEVENSWNDQLCGDQNYWTCEKKIAL